MFRMNRLTLQRSRLSHLLIASISCHAMVRPDPPHKYNPLHASCPCAVDIMMLPYSSNNAIHRDLFAKHAWDQVLALVKLFSLSCSLHVLLVVLTVSPTPHT